MAAGMSDEDAPAVEIGAIEHDLVMDFASRHDGRCDVPAPSRSASKRRCAHVEPVDPSRTGQPGQERLELSVPGDIRPVLGCRSAAGFAAPARPSSGGLTVLDELVCAYTTSGLIPRTGHPTCFQSMYTPLKPYGLLAKTPILYTQNEY